MALQHDNQGFLTGSQIDLGVIADLFRKVANDVKSIKTALLHGQQFTQQPAVNPDSRPAQPQTVIALPRQRDEQGRFKSSTQQAVEPRRLAFKTVASKSEPVAEPKRNSHGRFTSSDANTQGDTELTKAASRFAVAVKDAVSANGDVDPSVTAMKEVAEPLNRGIGVLFAGNDGKKQDRLLSKIAKTLDIFHHDSSIFDKKQKKLLEEIKDKPAGGGSWSISGGDGTTGGGIGNLLKGLVGGGLLAKLGKSAKTGGKGLLRKIPLIGPLLALGGAAIDIVGTESDETLTRRQKDVAAGQAVGGWSGSLAGIAGGAVLGSSFGPVGMVLGGVVGGFLGDQAGQIIGEQFGAWVSDLREYDLVGKIIASWNNAVTGIVDAAKQAWDKVSSIGSVVADVIKEQISDGLNYINGALGIDLKDMGGKWLDRTKTNIAETWEGVKSGASRAKNFVVNETTIGKASKRIAESFKGGKIPGLSDAEASAYVDNVKKTESSGNYKAENGLGFIGAYQMGAEYLADAGLVDLSKLKSAKKTGKFDQKAFLANDENWTIPGGKSEFMSNPALQDKAFADMQNKNFIAGVRSGAISMNASPEQIAAYLKAAHLGGAGGATAYFKHGIDARDANGTSLSRYATQGAAAIASAKAPNVPAPIAPPSVSAAPEIREPLNSTQGRPIIAHVPVADVGQEIKDRGIAHIVAGGIGSGL